MSEQSPQPEPTIETQRVLLEQVNNENSRRLAEAGLIEKVQIVYDRAFRFIDHDMFNYTAPEVMDDVIERHAEMGVVEAGRAIDPSSYTVSHRLSGMAESYSNPKTK
jgi:hypothetical protein